MYSTYHRKVSVVRACDIYEYGSILHTVFVRSIVRAIEWLSYGRSKNYVRTFGRSKNYIRMFRCSKNYG